MLDRVIPSQGSRHVVIDGCAVNRFALVNVDPTRALADTEFAIAITPALEAEYRRALDHLFVPSYVKRLLRVLLERATPAADPDERVPTDRQLLALARSHLVVTDDAKLYRNAEAGLGLIPWPDVELHLKADGTLVDLLRARIAS